MKYFLPEYVDISSPCLTEEERAFKEKQLAEACKKYREYIQKHIDVFSKSFLNKYRNGGFHDYKIKKIDFDFVDIGIKTSLNIIIILENNDERYFLISKDVTDFSSSISIENMYFVNDYLYGEYYKDNEQWHHNFLFGDYNEINITSKKFIFRKNTCY